MIYCAMSDLIFFISFLYWSIDFFNSSNLFFGIRIISFMLVNIQFNLKTILTKYSTAHIQKNPSLFMQMRVYYN